MKCIICHGEAIEVAKVKEEIPLKDDIVFVPVTVSVCRTCGERYYDRKTMRYLEEVARKLETERHKLREVGRVLVYD